MRKIEKYTGEKTYMSPASGLMTKDAVLKQYPAALTFTHIVETDLSGQVMWAIENLAAMKTIHGIPLDTPEDEAIAKLEEILNTAAPEPEPEPTPEERMAAAMEFQNMMSLSDAKEA